MLHYQFSSVESLGHVWLFATPWNAALQASLSITNSWSLLKLMSIELMMPSNHLTLCRPLLLLPSIFPSIRVFSRESVLCIINYSSLKIVFGGTSGKEPACQCRRCKRCSFHPWVGKIPGGRAWQTHSSNLAWRIPWTEEPGRLWSIGSDRFGHNWSDLACTLVKTVSPGLPWWSSG